MVTAPNTTPGITAPPRTALGTFGAFDRISVYLSPDGIEEESRSIADIERTRIFLDDIAMLTRCKRLNYWLLIPSALCVLFFGIAFLAAIALAIFSPNPQAQQTGVIAAVILSGPVVLFAVRIVFHLISKDDVITIFGRRRKIEIRFGVFRKKRCDQAYALLLAAVRDANARALERAAQELPAIAPVEDSPEMPPVFAAEPTAEAVVPEPASVPAPPPFAEPVTVSDDGIFVEYNPRAVPPKPARTAPMPAQREPDLPLMPEIKLTPKPPEAQPNENPPDIPAS